MADNISNNSGFNWLCSLLLKEERSDFKIVSKDVNNVSVTFPAHSLVFCTQSIVISNFLDSKNFIEGRTRSIPFIGRDARTVEYFLRFMYTKKLPELIPLSTLVVLLEMAHMYEVPDLLSECIRRIPFNLTVDTVCEIYESSFLRGLKQLEDQCMSMMLYNLDAILQNDLHYHLSDKTLREILKRMNAYKKELLRWKTWKILSTGSEDGNVKFEDLCLGEHEITSPFSRPNQIIDWVDTLCMNSYMSDIELSVENDLIAKFPAHSLVLNAQSEVFLSTWKASKVTDGRCVKITLKGLSARDAEYFLRYLYIRFFPTEIPEKNLINLMRAAYYYKIDALFKTCESRLINRVCIINCCQLLTLSKSLSSSSLEEKCMTKICRSMDDILRSYLHYSLNEDLLKHVLSSQKVTELSTTDRIELIKEWGTWYSCIQGISPSSIASILDPILDVASQAVYSPRPVISSNFMSNMTQSPIRSSTSTSPHRQPLHRLIYGGQNRILRPLSVGEIQLDVRTPSPDWQSVRTSEGWVSVRRE